MGTLESVHDTVFVVPATQAAPLDGVPIVIEYVTGFPPPPPPPPLPFGSTAAVQTSPWQVENGVLEQMEPAGNFCGAPLNEKGVHWVGLSSYAQDTAHGSGESPGFVGRVVRQGKRFP